MTLQITEVLEKYFGHLAHQTASEMHSMRFAHQQNVFPIKCIASQHLQTPYMNKPSCN